MDREKYVDESWKDSVAQEKEGKNPPPQSINRIDPQDVQESSKIQESSQVQQPQEVQEESPESQEPQEFRKMPIRWRSILLIMFRVWFFRR